MRRYTTFTPEPAGTVTAVTDHSSKAGWPCCSRGSSCALTAATVVDEGSAAVSAAMPFSLSVKVTDEPLPDCVQPSG